MTIQPENVENERILLPMFSIFMKGFKLNQLFRKWYMNKKKGFPVEEFFQMIFLLVLIQKNVSVILRSINPIIHKRIDTLLSLSLQD